MRSRQLSLFACVCVIASFGGLSTGAQAQEEPRCDAPQVMLVVDKSSSMDDPLESGLTKWQAARMAIGELTADFESEIHFGLQPFPVPDQCSAGEVQMEIGEHTSEMILQILGDPPPEGGNYTPMSQTLEQTGNYEPLTDPDRDNHVVLITDGWQWCDPYDPNTRFDPVDKVAALHDQGMTVHVVGFGSMVDTLTLNRSAVAGGTALPGCNEDSTDPSNPNNCYLQADDLTELRNALDDIGREVTEETCDGFDNDCDGEVDEGYDMDGDGFTTCGTVEDSPGETDDGLADCDDDNSDVNPAAEEICDGLDNDCDGRRDPGCACEQGEEQSCGTDIGECTPGTQFCEDGTWTECTGGVQPAETDVCDGTDEDCDEDIDEDADCGPERRCMDGECVRFSRDPDKPIDEEEPPSENGPRDAGTSAKEVAPSQDGGCCSVGGVRRPTGPLAAAGLLALLGLVVVRRRRR